MESVGFLIDFGVQLYSFYGKMLCLVIEGVVFAGFVSDVRLDNVGLFY